MNDIYNKSLSLLKEYFENTDQQELIEIADKAFLVTHNGKESSVEEVV